MISTFFLPAPAREVPQNRKGSFTMIIQKYTLAIATVVLALAGCGGGGSSSGGGATPQAVFDNFKSAAKTKDYKTAFAQTTPDSQEMVAGAMAMGMSMFSMMDPKKDPEANQILEKHGVKKLDMTGPPPNMNDPKSFMKQMVGGVKDKPACIAEIITWMEKNANQNGEAAPGTEEFANATLEDVKVDGNSATGTIKTKKGDVERKQDAKFQKIGDLWFVDFAGMMPTGGPPAGGGTLNPAGQPGRK
jgi:hypothetical protein